MILLFEKMNCRLRNTGKPEILLQYYGECESLDIITTTAINEALTEGSGEMPNKEIVAENDSTVRELESAQITETVLPMSHLHNGDEKSENELVAARKAVKARAVPSLFLDDIDSLNESEQAVLGLKKSDLVSGDSHPKHGAAEISYGAEHRTDRSIDVKPPSKVISMPSASQHFDMTQPCSAAECDKSKNPVCDSNNRTHKNMCMFKFYACKVNRLDGSTVELAHVGECTAESNLVNLNQI
ncbi:unnamed protein product [Nippostrongylus brasiliensis]|uniref:Kazal-like domain-containing protein n=1 Tax=Nippostrongylus brasiliensis TaxID=27835 RepID=A0A0N4YBR7_NIPBR|nr:unnamed protein product [Nippostrongylus brasiliensis]